MCYAIFNLASGECKPGTFNSRVSARFATHDSSVQTDRHSLRARSPSRATWAFSGEPPAHCAMHSCSHSPVPVRDCSAHEYTSSLFQPRGQARARVRPGHRLFKPHSYIASRDGGDGGGPESPVPLCPLLCAVRTYLPLVGLGRNTTRQPPCTPLPSIRHAVAWDLRRSHPPPGSPSRRPRGRPCAPREGTGAAPAATPSVDGDVRVGRAEAASWSRARVGAVVDG